MVGKLVPPFWSSFTLQKLSSCCYPQVFTVMVDNAEIPQMVCNAKSLRKKHKYPKHRNPNRMLNNISASSDRYSTTKPLNCWIECAVERFMGNSYLLGGMHTYAEMIRTRPPFGDPSIHCMFHYLPVHKRAAYPPWNGMWLCTCVVIYIHSEA